MSWNESEISTWDGFLEFVKWLKGGDCPYSLWFLRGQSDAQWELMPSLIRQLKVKEPGISIERALEFERGALKEFQSQRHAGNVDRSKWDRCAWWMWMQHYNCPTRVLDWTLSPYVALYFAIEENPDKDGAVWCISPEVLQYITEDQFGEYNSKEFSWVSEEPTEAVYAFEYESHNERSEIQEGVCTVCKFLLADHGDSIANVFERCALTKHFYKLIISSEMKGEFSSRLAEMNITNSLLLPGLDGIGKGAREYLIKRIWELKSEQKK